MLDICKRIKYICQKYDRKVHFYINMNGTIPFEDLYKEINNLHVSVSLTNELDHNYNRPGSYQHVLRTRSTLAKCTVTEL